MAQRTGFRGRHASRFRRDRTTGHPAGIAPWSHDGGCRSRSGLARGARHRSTTTIWIGSPSRPTTQSMAWQPACGRETAAPRTNSPAASAPAGVDQLPQRVRRLAAIWRLQGIGLGARDGRVRAQQLHRGEGGHGRAVMVPGAGGDPLPAPAGVHAGFPARSREKGRTRRGRG